jgi:hypothetical protein
MAWENIWLKSFCVLMGLIALCKLIFPWFTKKEVEQPPAVYPQTPTEIPKELLDDLDSHGKL